MITMTEEISTLSLHLIRIDGGTQSRTELSQDVIQDYAQAMLEGTQFPPIILFYDGADYWLADGFHRYHAAKQACLETINVEVRQGSRRDAVLFSVGANASHGLRRTNADKRHSVETLLRDEEWGKWSDREIARRCYVDHKTVAAIRAECSLGNFPSEDNTPYNPQIRSYTTKHGTIATMNTSSIVLSSQEQLREPAKITNEPPLIVQSLTSLGDIFPGFDEWQQQRPTLPESWKLPPELRGEPSAKSATLTALQSSESNEWYTPAARCIPAAGQWLMSRALRHTRFALNATSHGLQALHQSLERDALQVLLKRCHPGPLLDVQCAPLPAAASLEVLAARQ